MISLNWENREEILRAVRNYPRIFEEEIVASIEYAALVLVGHTADLAPVGTGGGGGLATSIAAGRPTPTGHGWAIIYGTTVDHAETIEYGRSPGSAFPPIEEIARWLYIKGPGLGFDIEDEEDAERLAFVVARSIARNGFKSGPVAGVNGGTAWAMFSRGQAAAASEIDSILSGCRDRIVDRINREAA